MRRRSRRSNAGRRTRSMRLTSRAVRKIRRLRSESLTSFPSALANAKYDPFNLRKIVQVDCSDFAESCRGSAGAASQALIHCGRSNYKVRCQNLWKASLAAATARPTSKALPSATRATVSSGRRVHKLGKLEFPRIDPLPVDITPFFLHQWRRFPSGMLGWFWFTDRKSVLALGALAGSRDDTPLDLFAGLAAVSHVRRYSRRD
jgi:hypothetical protein